MTLNPALKFHFLIWSVCNIYSSKPSSMPLSKLIWCPWTLEDKKIWDDRETLKFREQKQYFGIWILSQQRCYLKRNKTAILTQLPAKNPYPITYWLLLPRNKLCLGFTNKDGDILLSALKWNPANSSSVPVRHVDSHWVDKLIKAF